MAKTPLTDHFLELLGGATTARIDIHAGDGNLMIDGLRGEEQVLASGALQYLKKQGVPTRTRTSNNGQATLALRGGRAGQPWLHLPWSACNGATEWQIHLNPTVVIDITAHSDGGNLKLDLADLVIARLSADTGGGNIDLILPANPSNLSVNAATGAGNVTVSIPPGIEARIHAAAGLGKVIVDQRFIKIDNHTYQSAGFDRAGNRVEITAGSGAGNVIVQ